MAVARHSENIEVQDGDQDDTDYENDTTVTARRTNVERSEEGHYESLDLHKIGDAIYGDLRTKKKLSGRRPFRVVVGVAVCLGLILTGVTIAQAVHYGSASNRMKSNDTLTLENNQINILNNLNQEKDLLQSEINQLKTQIADYTNLNQEKDLLQREVNQLKTQIADKTCPCGWKKFAESCYYRTTGGKTWQQNREECQSQGADLVVINSREEQVFIRGLDPAGYYSSWIGLTRTQGSWTWVDGTPLTTQYWDSGYPHNDGYRNCALYNHGTAPGTWYNDGCSGTPASICETK